MPTAMHGKETKELLVRAARDVLAQEGFGAATARAIADRAGCNQALVHYHHGSVHQLLLAALDASSAERLERYRFLLGETRTMRGLLQVPAALYREDIDTGHIRVVTEMAAGSLPHPELRAAVAERLEPWLGLTESALRRVMRGTPFARTLPAREAAYGVVALFLGLELVAVLEGSHDRAVRLLERLARIGTRLDRLVPARRTVR